MKIKTSMLQPDLCDYGDTYIVFKETITVTGANNRNRKNKSLAFKKMLYLLVVYQRSIMY